MNEPDPLVILAGELSRVSQINIELLRHVVHLKAVVLAQQGQIVCLTAQTFGVSVAEAKTQFEDTQRNLTARFLAEINSQLVERGLAEPPPADPWWDTPPPRSP